ncbi:hypothetical protein OXPF_20330 [Oxobacter pfennigii]|uniref:Uncharacterized protein n=1 Tax=Oxobacter pfennigii TaxID=36849 RepID=A0A0P8WPC9_9CLOT|nr:hypothetical protein [Oxobacter pfennigii]KPU44414.1 hypothetical protein OXPF_20330 [Oxobacter pfennigii]
MKIKKVKSKSKNKKEVPAPDAESLSQDYRDAIPEELYTDGIEKNCFTEREIDDKNIIERTRLF